MTRLPLRGGRSGGRELLPAGRACPNIAPFTDTGRASCGTGAPALMARRAEEHRTMSFMRSLALATLAAALVLTGCGDDKKNPPAGGGGPAPAPGKSGDGGGGAGAGGAYEAAKGTATLKGVIKFKGARPAPAFADVGSEAGCKAHGDVVVEVREVNEDGSLPHAFVYASEGPSVGMKGYADPKIVMDQKGCAYIPHVLGALAGSEVTFRNSDKFNHNVHIKAKRNDEWNKVQSAGGEDKRAFQKEMGVRVACDVHTFMGSWMHVLEHPFFSTSARGNGAYEIKGLYPGKHKFKVWHETWAKDKAVLEFEIELKAGENTHDVEVAETK